MTASAALRPIDTALLASLRGGERLVRVVVAATQGSVPREVGAWMAVNASSGLIGTIGGGRLEHDAMAHALALLGGESQELTRRMALGPSLGQCCGGVVNLKFELLEPAQADMVQAQLQQEAAARATPIALFGGGHVGRAIVRALAPLPFTLRWIDSRDGVFPEPTELGLSAWPSQVETEQVDPVQDAVRDLRPGSSVLIMSFSHAEDLDIVMACLQRQTQHGDLPFIGLIGSRTKWATFRHRLEARGFTPEQLAHITCPIGLPDIAGKEPEVIAASVVAQLLALRGTQAR